MKLARVSGIYPQYWRELYCENPQLELQSYVDQLSAIHRDGFGLADNWKVALEKLGYEAIEIASNVEPLQQTWAKENGKVFSAWNWMHEITAAQIVAFKPDILFMFDYTSFGLDWLKSIRELCPSIKFVIGWCGAPFKDARVFKGYDLVLSCIPELVDEFRSRGHVSEQMHHAFDPRILNKIDMKSDAHIDFSFVGQIVRANKFHLEREELLEKIVDQIPIKIFSQAVKSIELDLAKTMVKRSFYYLAQALLKLGFSKDSLRKFPLLNKAVDWTALPVRTVSPKLNPHFESPVFGLGMFQTLRNSKITFNSHIDISPRSASNLRLFEATGVGTCLITDWKENLNSVFEDGLEVVSYRSADECIEKVRWLLDHPKERIAIAEAGQRRCLRDHTFDQRASQLDLLIQSALEKDLKQKAV